MHPSLRQQLLNQGLHIVRQIRPLVAAIHRKDRDLASQLQRALNSVILNVAEGFGAQAGNARLRFQSALGSLYEAQAALQLAAAWELVSGAKADELVRQLEAYGAWIYGLSRR
jgi:four helix bundle protein